MNIHSGNKTEAIMTCIEAFNFIFILVYNCYDFVRSTVKYVLVWSSLSVSL